jgi:putative ABC transport system permease protein
MLGIIIGVSNIILVVSVIQGGKASILKEFSDLGSNLISICGDQTTQGKRVYITQDELKAISKMPGVKVLTPEASLIIKINTKKILVIGTTSNLKDIQRIEIGKGRFISSTDNNQAKKICVISSRLSQELFKYSNPIGKKIRIQDVMFRVIGVVKEKDILGQMGFPVIYIPISAAQRLLGVKEIYSAKILAISTTQIETLIDKIKQFFERRDKDSLEVMNWKELIDSTKEVTNVIALIVGCIAAISLLVGGIGIMNIMLVQVRERTREIGLRKAIGASNEDILLQFLIESCVLSLGGGVIGIIIGISGANLVALLIELPPIISWESIVLGFGVSSVVGLFFGVYPANIAAKMDPIEALRYE